MKRLNTYILGWLLLSALACTSLSTGQDANLTPEPDQNRRVRLQQNTDVPLQQNMNEQSSDINRKRNIEEFDGNGPATTPPALRPQRVPDAPVDSAIHDVNRPIPTRVRPIDN